MTYGVMRRFGAFQSAWSLGKGSGSAPSMAAPPICPFSSACIRAPVLIQSPRAILDRNLRKSALLPIDLSGSKGRLRLLAAEDLKLLV